MNKDTFLINYGSLIIRSFRQFILYCVICFAGVGFSGLLGLGHQHTVWAQTENVRVSLISEVQTIQPGTPFWVGLHMQMAQGWHTYWHNPGDAGLGTVIDWNLPQGFEAGPIEWPAPERIEIPPLVSYGYEDEVLLMVEITPPASLPVNETIFLEAHTSWLECKDICLPGEQDLTLSLITNNSSPLPSRQKDVFDRMRIRLPQPIANTPWTLKAYYDENFIVLDLVSAKDRMLVRNNTPSKLQFFPENPDLIKNETPQVLNISPVGMTLELERSKTSSNSKGIPKSIRGILVADGNWSAETTGNVISFDVVLNPYDRKEEIVSKDQVVTTETKPGLGIFMLFAFMGGLILNLMPCVLPVISIKILGFVKQSQEDPKKIFQHGISFAMGILVAFWILAAVLMILRTGGAQLGWGFHLQSPKFLVGLSALFFLLALNMFGVFSIGTSLVHTGQRISKGGLGSSFANGVLATVVATPCTAPFMGSALGFALTQPVWVSWLIFTALGGGMAFPYFVLSLNPKLIRLIPKPGVWMESLKQFMGFLLLATVVWLLWVLGVQTRMEVIILILGMLLLLGLGGWILGRWSGIDRKSRTRWIARLIALGLMGTSIVWAMLYLHKHTSFPGTSKIHLGEIQWEEFSFDTLELYRQEKRAVFVDFTAAWCLTCQVNERTTLFHPKVVEQFHAKDVAMLKADWTRRNPEITQALSQFGRSGVPFYVLYPSDPQSKPITLPVILTPTIILEALEKI